MSVMNNIFYEPTDGFAVNTCGFSAPSCSISNNLVTNGTIGGAANCGGSAPACSIAHTIYADPQFVNTQAPYDFDVLSSSPAAGAGMYVPQATMTWDGTPRLANVYDIGAGQCICSLTPCLSFGVHSNSLAQARFISRLFGVTI